MQHSGSIKTMREICIPKFSVENGTYVVIPRFLYFIKIINSTKSAGLIGEFTINLYFDCKETEIELYKIDDPDNKF